MEVVSQKNYHLVDGDGNPVDLKEKEVQVLSNGTITKAKLTDLFISHDIKSNGKITGWSVLSMMRYKEGKIYYGEDEISFSCEDGEPCRISKVDKPWFQLNDKKLDESFIFDIESLLNSKENFVDEDELTDYVDDEEEQAEIDELVDEFSEEDDNDISNLEIPNKIDIDFDRLESEGYEVIEFSQNDERYKFAHKDDALPVLAKEIGDDHYEEFEFSKYLSETEIEFKNANGKVVKFEI